MDAATMVLDALILLSLFVAWNWLKGLPDAIHRRSEKALQQGLNRELESFKTELSRELELLKIAYAELHVRKTDHYIRFGKLQQKVLMDKKFQDRIKKGEAKAVAELQAEVLDLGMGLFFFASDSAVRDYGAWKSRSAAGTLSGTELLGELGRLMVVLRKDLGYADTTLGGDDFLRLFVTDWDQAATTSG